MSNFEDQLWSHLVDAHRADLASTSAVRRVSAQRARRPLVLSGTAVAIAAAAAATVALTATSSTTPAFAVTDNPNGTVTVTLDEISAISALNAELAQDGIRAVAVPLTSTCPTYGFPNLMPAGTDPSTYTITIDPNDIPLGYTGVVAAGENASGQIQLAIGSRPSSAVPSCINSTAIAVPPAGASTNSRNAKVKAALAAVKAAKR